MKTTQRHAASEASPTRRPAADRGTVQAAAAQPFTDSPRQAAQRQAISRLQGPSSEMPAQLGKKKKGPTKQELASKEQSKKDRGVNKTAKYSPDAVKGMEKSVGVKKTRELASQVDGHGSGGHGDGQNAATTKSLANMAKQARDWKGGNPNRGGGNAQGGKKKRRGK
jgi:hypothetical protein